MNALEDRLRHIGDDVDIIVSPLDMIRLRAQRRRRRRTLTSALAVTAIVLVATAGMAGLRTRATVVATTGPEGSPTASSEGTADTTSTLTETRRFNVPGNGTFELTTPSTFALATLPVTGSGGINWPVDPSSATGSVCCSRRYEIQPEPPEAIFGDALATAELATDAAGNPAYIITNGSRMLYPNSHVDFDVVVIGIGTHSVTISEPLPNTEQRVMSDDERLTMLSKIRVDAGPDATTDVSAASPLSIGAIDGPAIDFGPGTLAILGFACEPKPEDISRGQWRIRPVAADTTVLCDPDLGLTVRIANRLAESTDLADVRLSRVSP